LDFCSPPLSRRGKLKTRFLTRRRVRYGSVETGAHCAPLQVGVNIAHGGSPHPPLSRSSANFAKQIRRRSACRRLSSREKANVLRTSPFSVIMFFRMIVGLLLASPVKWEKICKQIGPPMAVEGFIHRSAQKEGPPVRQCHSVNKNEASHFGGGGTRQRDGEGFGNKIPSQSPYGASSPGGRAFHDSLTE